MKTKRKERGTRCPKESVWVVFVAVAIINLLVVVEHNEHIIRDAIHNIHILS